MDVFRSLQGKKDFFSPGIVEENSRSKGCILLRPLVRRSKKRLSLIKNSYVEIEKRRVGE